MAKPEAGGAAPVVDATAGDENNPLQYVHHLYGDRGHASRNGEYWFTWTPFTPAVIAWQSAERYLNEARDQLIQARKLRSFAIPGLDVEFAEFSAVLEVLIEDVDARAREANRVHRALDVANANYARVNRFSHDEFENLYKQVMGHVDDATREQGRRSPLVYRGPPGPDLGGGGDVRLQLPQPTGIGSDHGN